MLKLGRTLLNCYKNRISQGNISTTCISYCSNTNNKQQIQMDRLGKFTPIYKFPYIRALAVTNRMKFYHIALSAVAIPSSIICTFFNIISQDAVIFATTISIAGCLPLFGLGYLFQKFIGFVYYNSEDDVVRIAFIDSWGKRRDIEIPREDVVPLNDLPVSPTDGLYLNFSRFSTKDKMKLNLKFGEVLDNDLFKRVFSTY